MTSSPTGADPQVQAHLAAFERHAERGNWGQALLSAREAVKLAPVDPARLAGCIGFALGHEFLQDGIDLLEELRKREAQADPALVNTLGVLYLHAGKAAKALSLFELAVEREPANPLFLTNLGSVEREAGRLRQAADCWRKALAADVEYHRADYLLQYLEAAHEKDGASLPLAGPREGKIVLPYLPSLPAALPVYTVLIKKGRVQGEIEVQFPSVKSDRMFVFAKGRTAILASWDPNGLYLDEIAVSRVEEGRGIVHFAVKEASLRLQRRRLIRVLGFDQTSGEVRAAPEQPFSRIDILTLSAGGLSFRAPWFMSRNQKIDVTLQLGAKTHTLPARVVWARPVARRFVYGAEFLVNEQEKDEIARFIHQRQMTLRQLERK